LRSYPGFSLKEFLSETVVPIESCRSSQFTDKHGVEWNYNSSGYRTHPLEVVEDHVLVVGCSHTEGHGLQIGERWADVLESMIEIKIFNFAKGSANSEFCYQVLCNWTKKHRPKFVIVQWPNVFRKLVWDENGSKFSLALSPDPISSVFMQTSDDNFYQPWLLSIIGANFLCNQYRIPILNLHFDTIESLTPAALDVLKSHNIKLHLDHKREGETWFFDNAARDNMHHSAICNTKWAYRIKKLLEQEPGY